VLVMLQRRSAEPEPPPDPRLRGLRAVSGVVGVVLLVGAAAMFAAPVDLGKHWPWPLTPLLGRAVAAWYALFGTMLVTCAAGLRRRSEAVIAYATLASWSLLLLALPLLYDISRSGADFAIWLIGMVVLLALGAYGLAVSLPSLRSAAAPR